MDLGLTRLTQLAFGYWQSHVLFSLTETGVFDELAAGTLTTKELAERCGTNPDVTERVLDAGVALGMLKRGATGYSNAAISERFLVSDSPESMANWVRVMAGWTNPWNDLSDAVRKGVQPNKMDASGGAEQREFILGMHDFARRTAQSVPRAFDFGNPQRMVDIGGGAGTYAIAFAEYYSDLAVEVMDLESVTHIAEEVIKESLAVDRITTATLDYQNDGFGADLDIVFLSNVLHQESAEMATDMLRRAHSALADSKHVVVHGHFLNDSHTGPVFSTLHNLSAVVLWGSGRTYTTLEMTEMLIEAGFRENTIETVPVAGSTTELLVARK